MRRQGRADCSLGRLRAHYFYLFFLLLGVPGEGKLAAVLALSGRGLLRGYDYGTLLCLKLLLVEKGETAEHARRCYCTDWGKRRVDTC